MQRPILSRISSLVAGTLVLLVSLSPTASAAESQPAAPFSPPAETVEFPHHHFGFFTGGATRYIAPEEEEEETGLAIGVEYEYRFAEHWGAGLLFEGVVTDHARDGVLGVPLSWHPWEWLKLSAAPGIEFVEHGSHEFVMRLAAAYEFEFGAYNLAPEISVDLTRQSQTLVYGLSFGRRF